MHMRSLGLSLAALLIAAPAQSQSTAVNDSTRAALNVFLDCESHYCDFDFFRTEITAVNWVRDRQVADVHVLVSTQSTGAGGTEFTLAFLGLRGLGGVGDTLKYVARPAS